MTRPVEAGMRLGRYVLLRPIGAGGMAEVWAARDDSLQRTVAIKMILAEIASRPEFASRFLREARVAALLDHPHIVKIYDMGDLGGRPYLVTQYLDRGRLTDRLVVEVPTGVALRWLGALASALDFAHGKGVVHRDVKPANVLFDSLDRPCLADFGLARSAEDPESLTLTGIVLGTPSYMSPEQASGLKIDARSDQYSLAMVAYRALTGRLPFDKLATPILLHKIITADVPPPSTANDRLPRDLDRVFARALNKDAFRRYSSCEAFLEDMRRAMGLSPTGAEGAESPPVSALSRTETLPRALAVGEGDETASDGRLPASDRLPLAEPAPGPELSRAPPSGSLRPASPGPLVPLVLIGITVLAVIGGVAYWREGTARSRPASAPVVTAPTAALPPPPELPAGVVREPQPLEPPAATDRRDVAASATVPPPSSVRERVAPTPPAPSPVSSASGLAGIRWAMVPSGAFAMGCTEGDLQCLGRENPVRRVTIANQFQMASTETTNAQYRACVAAGACRPPSNVAAYDDPRKRDHPVVFVSWEDAVAFCQWAGGRLPAEAEWEYAARGGKSGWRYPGGNEITREDANFKGIGGRDRWAETSPVGSFPPNGFGLHDMAGNVREWCADLYGPYGSGRPTVGAHVTRGGSWGLPAPDMRVSQRIGEAVESKFVGFRVVRTLGGSSTSTATEAPARSDTGRDGGRPRAGRSDGGEALRKRDVAWVKIRAAVFTMGCTRGDPACERVEEPAHRVRLSKDFWMAAAETTNRQYRVCVEAGFCSVPGNRKPFDDPALADHPVSFVSFENGVQFCSYIGARLPTEAEWEYSARGGSGPNRYPNGNEISHGDGNIDGTGDRDEWLETSPVGSFPPNGFGLYDMAGNVAEICADVFDGGYYARGPTVDPQATPSGGKDRVLRGGSFGPFPIAHLRVSQRSAIDRTAKSKYVGFRCARNAGR